jgi:hypothetical protein
MSDSKWREEARARIRRWSLSDRERLLANDIKRAFVEIDRLEGALERVKGLVGHDEDCAAVKYTDMKSACKICGAPPGVLCQPSCDIYQECTCDRDARIAKAEEAIERITAAMAEDKGDSNKNHS